MKWPVGLISAFGFMCVALLCEAQTNTSVLELGEVNVSARKSAERLEKVPLSVSVLSLSELETAGIETMQEVSEQVPNFNYYTVGSRRTALFYMRGIGSSGPNKPAVGLFVDDVYIPKTGCSDLELFDLERVEVLRGPQSTMYGRNTEAGAVKLYTRQPGPVWSGRVVQDVGNYHYLRTQLSAEGPLNDWISVSIAGVHRQRDGYTHNDFLDKDVDDIKESSGRLSLRLRPTESWDIRLSVMADRDRDGGYPLSALDNVKENPFHVEHNIEGSHDRDLGWVNLHVAYDCGPGTFKSISSYTDWDNHDIYDSDFTARDMFWMDDRDDLKAFTQELRYESPLSDERSIGWLAGMYYMLTKENDKNEFHYGSDAGLIGATPGAVEKSDQDEDGYTISVFGRTDWRMAERWTLAAGLRYDYEYRERDTTIETRPASAYRPDVDQHDTQQQDQLSPEASLEYKLAERARTYVRVARGWRSGGFNNPLRNGDIRYDPEYCWSYEWGIKSFLWEDRLMLNLSLFYMRIHDQQLIQYQPYGAGYYFINAGKTESKGAELELALQPWAGMELRGAVGYVDAKLIEGTDDERDVSWDDNRLPSVPRWNYALSAQQRYGCLGGSLVGRVEVNGVSDIYWDEANEVETSGYTLVNARVGYEQAYWGVYLYARNLFDKDYIAAVSAFPGSTPLAQPGDPQTYGISLSARF